MRILPLFLILIGMQFARAHEARDCDSESMPAPEAVRKAVRICLEKGELNIDEVRTMISRPNELVDPFNARHKDIHNLDLRRSVMRWLARLNPMQVPHTQQLLRELIGEKAAQQIKVQTTREMTAPTLNPRFVKAYAFSTETIDIPIWHTTKNGDLRLISLDIPKAHLRIIDPHRKDPIVDKELRPDVGNKAEIRFGRIDSIKTQDGRLLLLHHYSKSQQVLIYDVTSDRSALTELPSPVENLTFALGKNGGIHLIAQAVNAILTYSIDPGLHLHEHNRRQIHASSIDVATSQDGQIKVAASVGDKGVAIFDPINGGTPRLHTARSRVDDIKGTFTPKGEYVAAIRTQAQGADVEYEFLTSKSEDVFVTTPFSPNTIAREWFITQQGRALFPIRATYDQDGHYLYIYDPLHPKLEPKANSIFSSLNRGGRELAPLYKLDGGTARGRSAPTLFESPDQRLLLVEGTELGDSISLAVFDPARQFQAIHAFPLEGFDSVRKVKAGVFKDTGQTYFLVLRDRNMQIHIGLESAQLALTGESDLITPVVMDKDGNLFFAGISIHGLQIYRLTTTKNGDTSYE